VVAPDPPARATRRQLLAGAGAAAVGLSGCSVAQDRTVRVGLLGSPARLADIRLLNNALSLEFRTIAAYTAGIPHLEGPIRRSAVQFLHEELSHMARLESLIRRTGGLPFGRQDSYSYGHAGPGGPPHSTPRQVLLLLHALEQAQLSTYLQAIPQLAPGPVRGDIAAILANQAQHIAILRSALGLEAVPAALVNGGE
jgi:ferritin-like protein